MHCPNQMHPTTKRALIVGILALVLLVVLSQSMQSRAAAVSLHDTLPLPAALPRRTYEPSVSC